ncbi:putative protein phosphatase 2C-like protein 44 [Sesamum indicum]|uniref:PPM-type phosphatase domain-containing protein n=1 Tax=Sesamum indicum TaxID=4182 RepID=A0A6I9TW16_SESIN|nr:putative protein phosphatase 2C-like protein 44 [Sesamum indicum]
MGLRHLHLKIKRIKLRRFLPGNGRRTTRETKNGKRVSWMTHVSYGYHVAELDEPCTNSSSVRDFDSSVLVQREQMEECELWFFGVFDDGIGEGITKYLQSHFFDKTMPKELRMGKKSKEAMERAHLNARTHLRDRNEPEETAWKLGSASAMVINGEKLVMAYMGDYSGVICRDGQAYQISRRKPHPTMQHWSLKLISGMHIYILVFIICALRVPKLHILGGGSRTTSGTKSSKGSELIVGSERIDSETEFVILASTGVWEVMRHQEAVNLIRHIEDPQAAAECLVTEALTRMSRSKISCLIIRFD